LYNLISSLFLTKANTQSDLLEVKQNEASQVAPGFKNLSLLSLSLACQ